MFFQKATTRHNLCSEKYSQVRSRAQYNARPTIITSLAQRKSMLRREKCVLEVHFIADGTLFERTKLFASYKNKLQMVVTLIKFQKAFVIHPYKHGVVEHGVSWILGSLLLAPFSLLQWTFNLLDEILKKKSK